MQCKYKYKYIPLILIFTFLVGSINTVLSSNRYLPDTSNMSESSHLQANYDHKMHDDAGHTSTINCSTNMAGCLLSCSLLCAQLLSVNVVVNISKTGFESNFYKLPAARKVFVVAFYRPPIIA